MRALCAKPNAESRMSLNYDYQKDYQMKHCVRKTHFNEDRKENATTKFTLSKLKLSSLCVSLCVLCLLAVTPQVVGKKGKTTSNSLVYT